MKMKKDKKWFVDKWTKERDKTDVHDPMYHFINEFIADVNQLDEPEVLSQEWIDKYSYNIEEYWEVADMMDKPQYAVSVENLQNLLVPNQVLPVIPKFVADFIEVRKDTDAYSLKYILYEAVDRSEREEYAKAYDWISASDEAFARAWLYGYKIEEEPKFYVLDKEDRPLLLRFVQGITRAPSGLSPIDKIVKNQRNSLQFTEQEIKDYDERYWPFSVKVEELEE